MRVVEVTPVVKPQVESVTVELTVPEIQLIHALAHRHESGGALGQSRGGSSGSTGNGTGVGGGVICAPFRKLMYENGIEQLVY